MTSNAELDELIAQHRRIAAQFPKGIIYVATDDLVTLLDYIRELETDLELAAEDDRGVL
jgi:hypothetical protein